MADKAGPSLLGGSGEGGQRAFGKCQQDLETQAPLLLLRDLCNLFGIP